MSKRPRFANIDDYIAAAAPGARPVLATIRATVHALVPDATETISYQMPAFKRGRVFFYFAAFQKHIGVYPPVGGDTALDDDLLPYRGEKGNLKFPLAEPIPFGLIGRVAAQLSRQYAARADPKAGAR